MVSTAQETPSVAHETPYCFIVGIGACAGGLEALQEFFSLVPPDSGVAFVVVAHQPTGHSSLLADILGHYTDMPVRDIMTGARAVPNTVYVSPPGVDIAISQGVLALMPEKVALLRLPIVSPRPSPSGGRTVFAVLLAGCQISDH